MHIKFDMKQQAKITGPKVHDVGYRVFLMEAAMNCGVMRISAYWHEEDSLQVVICLVEKLIPEMMMQEIESEA